MQALEPIFLSKHRFAKILLHITTRFEGSHEQDMLSINSIRRIAQNKFLWQWQFKNI